MTTTTVNYITPRGLEIIRRELEWLERDQRPDIVAEVQYAAEMGDRSENAEYIYGKKKLRQIDKRRRYLMKRLEKPQLVDPTMICGPVVRFGATVVVADEAGEEKTWRIYGEDEVDIERGILSWRSPLAQAMLGKEDGAEIRFKAPGGVREFELLEVRYDVQADIEENEWKVARYTRA